MSIRPPMFGLCSRPDRTGAAVRNRDIQIQDRHWMKQGMSNNGLTRLEEYAVAISASIARELLGTKQAGAWG